MKNKQHDHSGCSSACDYQESQHTPTPWFTMPLNPNIFLGKEPEELAVCNTNMKLPPEQNEANAAFIVRAVNAHEELVNLLKAMLPFVSIAGHQINGRRAFDVVKEAIAKAEGK